MAQWSDLPLELWTKIAESIHYYEDFSTFGEICSVWRTAMKSARRTKSSTNVPWLLLAEPACSSTRRFYSLYNKKVLTVELPKPSTTRGQAEEEEDDVWYLRSLFPPDKEDDGLGDWRYFSSRGWLICVTQIGLNITLMNPISKQVIQPPAIPLKRVGSNYQWYIYLFSKFVLSDNPLTSNDYILAMINSPRNDLAFWKSGDKAWTTLSSKQYCQYLDIIFYRGEFYALDQFGQIIAVGNSSPPAHPRLVANLQFPCTVTSSSYLIESAGKLLLLFRELDHGDDDNYDEDDNYIYDPEAKISVDTRCFKVWEINVETGEATRVNDLGNRALFIGLNSSFSVEACPPVSRPNCIYYTDNYCHNYLLFPDRVDRCDMGVYDLSLDWKIEDFYEGPSCLSTSTLPLWVETP